MDEALRKVGLSLAEVQGRFPHELSGGQLQRAAIARALIPNPKLLIADEPVSMVDASLRMAIVNLLRSLRDDFGVSVIYITHDLATAYYISDRIIIMQKGHVVEMGPARPILDAPAASLFAAAEVVGAVDRQSRRARHSKGRPGRHRGGGAHRTGGAGRRPRRTHGARRRGLNLAPSRGLPPADQIDTRTTW